MAASISHRASIHAMRRVGLPIGFLCCFCRSTIHGAHFVTAAFRSGRFSPFFRSGRSPPRYSPFARPFCKPSASFNTRNAPPSRRIDQRRLEFFLCQVRFSLLQQQHTQLLACRHNRPRCHRQPALKKKSFVRGHDTWLLSAQAPHFQYFVRTPGAPYWGQPFDRHLSNLPLDGLPCPYNRGSTIPLCDWYFPFLSL